MAGLVSQVYFDNNATTPVDPRVAEAMIEWIRDRHGNPSSVHQFGQAARQALEVAREQVAALLGADPLEVVFVASGTEANNAVLRGLTESSCRVDGAAPHLVVTAMEHPSILASLDWLRAAGVEVTQVPPEADGVVSPGAVEASLKGNTRLVVAMLANNELGTLQPIREITERCHARGIAVLCDAVQAVGKVPVSMDQLGVDFLVVGAHKFHGPLGAAALVARESERYSMSAYLTGGSQERRRRAGTENLPALVGFGKACELAKGELDQRHASLLALRDAFEAGLAELDDVVIHCQGSPRLPHTSHVAFLGARGYDLMVRLDMQGYAVSTGAACASGVIAPSATLMAMGMSEDEALASLRISFGLTNTEQQIAAFLPVLAEQIAALREYAR
jgi:cysteine desulfurase